jgi:hypothetical protein
MRDDRAASLNRRQFHPSAIILHPWLWALLLIAFLGGLHNLWLIPKFDLGWSGDLIHFHGDEYHKMCETNAALNGNWLVGNPFLHEMRSYPATVSPFGAAFLAALLKITRLDLGIATWILDFLVPALAWVIVFAGAARLWPGVPRVEQTLIFAAGFVVFVLEPTLRPITRFLHAQVTLPFFLYLFLAALRMRKGRIAEWELPLMAILSGVFVHMDIWYPFVLGCLYVWLMLSELMRGETRTARRFAILIAGLVVIGCPEFLRLREISSSGVFRILEERTGSFATFMPGYPKYMAWMAVLGAFLLVAGRRRALSPGLDYFVPSLVTLGVTVVLYFQNLVTGKRLYFQGEHAAALALIPAFVIVTGVLVNFTRRIRSVALRRTGLLVLLLLAVANHAASVYRVAQVAVPADTFHPIYGHSNLWKQNAYRAAFAWLKANGRSDEVVLAEPCNDALLRLKADKWAYSSLESVFQLVDQETINRRYYPFLWMKPVLEVETPEDPVWRMHEQLRNYDPVDYGRVYCSAGTALPHQMRVNAFVARWGFAPLFGVEETRGAFQNRIDRLYGGFRDFTAGRTIRGVADLLDYRCDYVLWGPEERGFFPAWDPAKDATIVEVFRDDANGVTVHRLRSGGTRD